MPRIDDHPTVQNLRATTAGAKTRALSHDAILEIARTAGADDCGLVHVDNPKLADDRPFILNAFPQAQSLLVFVKRTHRQQIRSPARSVANLEFHECGHEVDAIARRIVRRLEDDGMPALNPAMAFPMELDSFPGRGWIVSYKLAAEAAGLGKMGIHRSLIHPTYGSFVLIGAVLIGTDVDTYSAELDYSPCLECKLCVAACPVGAIKPDGFFDFSACLTHNYNQFLGGSVNFFEDLADGSASSTRSDAVSYSESAKRWQSLAYGPNYNAAYCIAACPAGENVLAPFVQDRSAFVDAVVKPLQDRAEPVYVASGTDAADFVARRYPHKDIRVVRSAARATTIKNFREGLSLNFQRGKAKGLSAVYHLSFTGSEPYEMSVAINSGVLSVSDGFVGTPDVRIRADAQTWLRFINGETSIIWSMITRKIRINAPIRLMQAFGRCFPS